MLEWGVCTGVSSPSSQPPLLLSLLPSVFFPFLPSSPFSFPSLSTFSTHFLCPPLLPSSLPPSSILKYITLCFLSASGHEQSPYGPVFVKTSSSAWFFTYLKVWGKTSKPKTAKTNPPPKTNKTNKQQQQKNPKTHPKQRGLYSRDKNPRNLKYLLRSFTEKVCQALKYMIHIIFTCFFLLLLGVAAGNFFIASCFKLHCIPPGGNYSL